MRPTIEWVYRSLSFCKNPQNREWRIECGGRKIADKPTPTKKGLYTRALSHCPGTSIQCGQSSAVCIAMPGAYDGSHDRAKSFREPLPLWHGPVTAPRSPARRKWKFVGRPDRVFRQNAPHHFFGIFASNRAWQRLMTG